MVVMKRHIRPWLRGIAARAEIWRLIPGRAYLPGQGLETLAEYVVETTQELEDRSQRRSVLYRLRP
jgi:predicted nicotinamide N-methyase